MSPLAAAIRSGGSDRIRERGVCAPSEKYSTYKIKDTYEQLSKIGEGGQGKLWIVKRKRDKKILVRKEQNRFEMHSSGIPSEMHIFENILTSHPRIIEFDHANYISDNGADHGSLVLYFEHCQGGDLSEYTPRAGNSGVSEKFLWQCFVQLADAIAFLHYGYNRFAKNPDTPPRNWRRIVHCDIKPANVFLRRKLTKNNPVPDIVLGDFGLATLTLETYGGGTDEWIGPEIPLMTKQNDVWGVGAVVHALAHGKGPVSRPPKDWPSGKDGTKKWYTHPKARQPKELPMTYSSEINRNMMDCLIKDHRKRVNSLQLVKNLVAERPRPKR